MLIIVFLLSTLYCRASVDALFYVSQNQKSDSNYDGYIIKFYEEPLSIFENRLRSEMKYLFPHLTEKLFNTVLTQRVLSYKNKILSNHKDVKEDILGLVGRNYKDIFSKEFSVLFNGIKIKKVPDIILKKIGDLSNIMSIVPDYNINIKLNDSIPIINADDVWKLHDCHGKNITGSGVTIAILDTGIDYNHPDLKDNFIEGYDFVNNDNDPLDDNGHGTHCAGIAVGTGASSNFKFVGVATGADLYAYKVMDANGNGYISWFLEGMERSIDPNEDGDFSDHVDIISISAGDPCDHPDNALIIAANNAVDFGIVVVASAGNNGPTFNTISSPGCAQKVICVGATDDKDEIAVFSSRGSEYLDTIKPDVVAPGVNITSTWIGGGYKSLSGTSMACPHTSGTVALLLQMHPNWTPDEIKMVLRSNAVDLGYNIATQGYGRINVFNSVIISGTPPISILNISDEITYDLVEILGTALAYDFQNFSLYYKIVNKSERNTDWIELYKGEEEVNSGILFTWDTHLLQSGKYELKLEVRNNNQTSLDIAPTSLKSKDSRQKLFIQAPDKINASEYFVASAIDIDDVPQVAWFLLTFPHNYPKIKFGVFVTFKSPLILGQHQENLKGKLTVFNILGGYKISKKCITVVKT